MKSQMTAVKMIVSNNGRYTIVSCNTYKGDFEGLKTFVKQKGNYDTIEISSIIPSHCDGYAEFYY